jgi:hypothetical protein
MASKWAVDSCRPLSESVSQIYCTYWATKPIVGGVSTPLFPVVGGLAQTPSRGPPFIRTQKYSCRVNSNPEADDPGPHLPAPLSKQAPAWLQPLRCRTRLLVACPPGRAQASLLKPRRQRCAGIVPRAATGSRWPAGWRGPGPGDSEPADSELPQTPARRLKLPPQQLAECHSVARAAAARPSCGCPGQ